MKHTMPIPNHILTILQILWSHDAEAFLVGGCVRDMFLHRQVHDYDITTNALPKVMMKWFMEAHYLVIPTGLKHGTITVIDHGEPIEITTYRYENSYLNHRSPEDVRFTTSLIEDLKRRDFTMNAIAYAPNHGIVDPYNGIEDIKQHCIRCVGNPLERFQEDALRMLRALRFSCTLKFKIESGTWIAIQQLAKDLRYVSGERKRDEFNRILMCNYNHTLQFLKDANVLCEILPGYDSLYNHMQPTKWHIYDIFTHTDVALNHTIDMPLTTKLAIVLHDIGKPICESFDAQGVVHFKGHAHVSKKLAKEYLSKLHYDNATIQRVCTLIEYHDYYLVPKRKVLRKYLSKFQNDLSYALEALDVQIADNYGKSPKYASKLIENIHQCKEIMLLMEQENDLISLKDVCLNGHDLLALGYQGKEIGTTLQYLYETILEDPSLNTKEQLLTILKTYKHHTR